MVEFIKKIGPVCFMQVILKSIIGWNSGSFAEFINLSKLLVDRIFFLNLSINAYKRNNGVLKIKDSLKLGFGYSSTAQVSTQEPFYKTKYSEQTVQLYLHGSQLPFKLGV